MKNLRITVNGIPYDVQVEELGAAAPAPDRSRGVSRPCRGVQTFFENFRKNTEKILDKFRRILYDN